jgi:hypothetical protein
MEGWFGHPVEFEGDAVRTYASSKRSSAHVALLNGKKALVEIAVYSEGELDEDEAIEAIRLHAEGLLGDGGGLSLDQDLP